MSKRLKTILYTGFALYAGFAAVSATYHSETVAFTPLNVLIAFAVFFAMLMLFVPMMRLAFRSVMPMHRFLHKHTGYAGRPLLENQAEWYERNPMLKSFIGK